MKTQLTGADVLAFIGTALMLAILIVAVIAWPAMILIGVAHSTNAIVPAFGYWTTFFLGLAGRLLLSTSVSFK